MVNEHVFVNLVSFSKNFNPLLIFRLGKLCVFQKLVPHTLILIINKHDLKLKTNIKHASAFLLHLALAF